MDVSQVINLAAWVGENLPKISAGYSQLHKKVHHNAQQAQKEPLRDELNNLCNLLDEMSFKRLTNEEIDLLRNLETLQYLGDLGCRFVNQTISTSDFDPVSAATDLQAAIQKINETTQKFKKTHTAMYDLGLELLDDEHAVMQLPLVRVRFKEEASVDDIAKLKKWTADWYDIARGAALSVGETPQDVKVLSANNGSIIVTLGTVATVTTVLAVIAKNAGRIASEVLSIANDIEDFRHKRRLNKVIEEELIRQQTEVQENGIEDTLTEIKETVPNLIEKEVDNALKKAITKYFDFYKKGGDVDFIPPRSEPDAAEGNEDDQGFLEQIDHQAQENEQLVALIEQVRSQQAEIKQLVHHRVNQDEHGDQE
ncbi:hypothetical protein [Tritonibacter scottomollicae]|uniref:Uncharacterized protein n=1 Tax=Tritonibacter scottomollicae TaxID=483013 RepID=A0A2T1AI95_TRISK|nr:hypothetical protein [Tritonibacter scottomollicae]PRZ48316.1 hypothetical protein CLV89_104144 [Tritonibacter scottomollicae]